jgi:transcriptional regulator with XRE-family HTH domain
MAGIGESVKTLRTELGFPQRWLAEQVGVSQQTIARWESGGEVPTKYLRDLAVALDCSIADLVGGGEPHSFVAQVAAKKAGRFEGEIDRSEVRFGTLRLRFLPSTRELLNPVPESEDRWPKPFEREYAISNGERRRIAMRLDDLGQYTPTWFTFESLDNRFVFVNRSQLESLEMVHDDIEDTPPWEHEEIYRALDDDRVRDVLEGREPIESFDAEDAPFSRATIDRCFALAESVGGVEELLNRVRYVFAETIDGRQPELFSDPGDETFNELSLLAIELDGIWTRNSPSVDDWLVELESEQWWRSSLYRLGSLRVIEVPLQKYLDAQRRLFDEAAAGEEERQNQEEENG